MTIPVTLTRDGDIAVLTIANPPVNALSAAVVSGLTAAVQSGRSGNPDWIAWKTTCEAWKGAKGSCDDRG